jgi:hypothetical protein
MLLVGALASAGQWVMDGVGMKDHRTTPAPELAAPNGATSQVDLEMAYDKATRPWFKKKRLVLPLSLMLLIVIIAAVNAGGERGSSSSTAGSSQSEVEGTPQADKVVAGIGTKVRDGKFEFVVTAVERPGKTLVGKLDELLTAHGEFVIVRVNVTNIGNQAQSPDCSCQLLFNDEGREFEPSPAILSTKGALKFVRQINPGETVKDILVLFDVAPGTNVVNIELHDSPFSTGAKVELS